MRVTVFFKAFFWYAVLAIVLLSTVLIYSISTMRDHYVDTLTAHLSTLGNTFSLNVQPLVETGDLPGLNRVAADVGEGTGTRITVIDRSGVVLADSKEDPLRMENHKDRPEISRALRGGVGSSTRFSETMGEDMHYVAVPLVRDGDVIGVLRVSRFLTEIDSVLWALEKRIITIALIALVISLVGAFVFSATFTRPVRDLIAASRNVANGDLDTRVILSGRDELRELGDSFNVMTARIQQLVGELSRRQEELSSVISSIRDGLAVLNNEGRVILSNEAFRSISGEADVDGKFYWEVLRNAAFGDLVKTASEEKRSIVGEVRLEGGVYSCGASFVEAQEEVVVWLHDITEIRSVEKVKRDFIVNLSHELRTPLTAMKGFLEAASDEVDDEARHYLDIVARHTDRLADIVEDLLDLSELEARGTELEVEEVDLEGLVREVACIFEQRVKEKGLALSISAGSEVPRVSGDSYKLQQVFVNLIDNAVKYTEEGRITITIGREGDMVTASVTDTGIGIPEEHRARVFERFYVVDKSRSRKVGGTGLGLSIVKHIVLMHGGDIAASAESGGGTTFKITLPVAS
jgi:two-component system phosphate regulon sensor histidine kinase PhoR